MTEWQPMSTVPKDGTVVILNINRQPVFAAWIEESETYHRALAL